MTTVAPAARAFSAVASAQLSATTSTAMMPPPFAQQRGYGLADDGFFVVRRHHDHRANSGRLHCSTPVRTQSSEDFHREENRHKQDRQQHDPGDQ